VFIDGFSQLFQPIAGLPNTQFVSRTITLDSRTSWAAQLAKNIVKSLGETKTERPSLFIEGLDFLLASGGDDITANEILALLSVLSEARLLTSTILTVLENLANVYFTLRRP
jgi:hypothetical protein